MRLAAKIFAASVIPLLILIEVAGWSLNAVNRLVRTNRTIVTETLPALREATMANEALTAMARHQARWALLKDDLYATLWAHRAQDLERSLAELGGTLGSPLERRLVRKTRAAFVRYRSLVSDEIDGTPRLRPLGNRELRLARRAVDRVSRTSRRIGPAIDEGAQQAQWRIAELETRTWKTVLIALPVAALLAIVLSFIVAVRVTRVLRQLTAASAQLAQGVPTDPVRVRRGDELGDLARAFDAMAARLGEIDRMKEQVFSHLSHELRTPLTSIREATHLLADGVGGPLAPRQDRLVTIIGDSTERLLRLVNRILDLSRLRAGLQPLEQRPVHLVAVAARALHELRPQADSAQVRVDQAGNGADPVVVGDEERLVEVVVNLVSNAIKASVAGQHVRVRVEEDGALVVEDEGVGIPANALARIFDPYVQAPGAPAGTGLGLAIVKSIVEAHRGAITVWSEEGRGSRFTIRLPATEAWS